MAQRAAACTVSRYYTMPCTVSRYTLPCAVCARDIVPGDRMFCTAAEPPSASETSETSDGDDGAAAITTRPSLAWGHEMCYSSNLPPPPACRHWQRLGRCPAKEMGLCAFLHDERERGVSTTLDKQRWGGKRHFVRNQHKNSVFRTFLMQTYGLEYLTSKGGVILDVAGGKGELSFELINLCGVKECVVVDPRPLNLSLVRGKWEKGLFEPKRTGVFSKWYPACEEGCKDRTPESPAHIRCFFDGASFLEFVNAEASEEVERTNEKLLHEMKRAKSIVWTSKGLQHEDGASYNEEEENEAAVEDPVGSSEDVASSSNITDPSEARTILQRCHLIVGFHPDQAAGEIVAFAKASNIPWCLVPCCVYSDTFSKRKLVDGTNVKTHEHLVQWLQERDPNARVATLDLEGKNTVVYTLPETPATPRISKNAPRFLDYRRSSLPLDVALSFALPTICDEGLGGISARNLILSGRVFVNGEAETSYHRLVSREGDCISIACNEDGTIVEMGRPIPSPRYFVCYKPRGVVCSSRRNEGIDREGSVLISEWLADVGCSEGGDAAILCGGGKAIETVGRLDEESEGLLLLTNDGSFSRLLCSPEFGLRKTYRVVVRGRGYSRLVAGLSLAENDEESEHKGQPTLNSTALALAVAGMIQRGNRPPASDENAKSTATPHFPFEGCQVLDVGKLPSQHLSDDSFYALVDLVLREGKRHAVRRIIANAGMSVCYLSRIAVEGLEDVFDVVKPETIAEAWERGFLPGGRHRETVPAGTILRPNSDGAMLLPGHVIELRDCGVDRVFALRG